MHHTATSCNTLHHAATHCNTQQHRATHCNTPQHTATHYNTNRTEWGHWRRHGETPNSQESAQKTTGDGTSPKCSAPPYDWCDIDTLQHAATHCNTLQHTATHCNTLQHTATHCNTLQHTATHCNTLQHTAAHGSTRQHTIFCKPTYILKEPTNCSFPIVKLAAHTFTSYVLIASYLLILYSKFSSNWHLRIESKYSVFHQHVISYSKNRITCFHIIRTHFTQCIQSQLAVAAVATVAQRNALQHNAPRCNALRHADTLQRTTTHSVATSSCRSLLQKSPIKETELACEMSTYDVNTCNVTHSTFSRN